MANINEIESFEPANQKDWRKWLKLNHTKEKAIWLIIWKKDSSRPNLTWGEAVDEALCFGWIDSVKRPIDSERYTQYFSPRKPKSNWSKINKEKIAKLIQNNLMTKAGFDSIETAKQNGSWIILDKVEALVIPKDLEVELENFKGSMEYFTSLSKSDKKILLHWVLSAKRPETKQKRILEIAENACKNSKPKQFR
jgi:uncharacterized protein YdeI (YjbR/CyaY-like superfamily)